MKKIKVGLFGGSGRMGQQVVNVLNGDAHTPYIFVGKAKADEFAFSVTSLRDVESDVLNDVDVWIDFTSPEGFVELLEATRATPIVSGSTGMSEKQFSAIKKHAGNRPLFWASNMSIGLWAFRQALKSFKDISDFDFAVDEIHHTKKKDMPSGTAKTIQQDLIDIVKKDIPAPAARRLGGVYGIHTVYAASDDEIITFQHQAINRKVFASGAVRAAEWILKQKNGFYSMDDMFLKRGKK